MGKASSAKKIKRVQQAGVSRAPGQRRNLGYPALIIGILVVGTVLTVFARSERAGSAAEAPVANRDHWHAAFGINLCGAWEPNLNDAGPDTKGIHTHADGLIHIHPFGSGGAGERAVFQVFADQTGIELGDGSFTLPNGQTYSNGDDCEISEGKVEPGRVALYVWPPQATEATEPKVLTGDIAEEHFAKDGQIFVLAFVPEDTEVGFPPSLEELASPNDLETPSQPGSVDFTVPGAETPAPTDDGTATTAPAGDGSATTAPAGDGTATTAPETTQPGG